MAKIQRIGHDHKTPFWVVLVFVVGLLVVQGQAKTYYHMANISNILTDSGPPIKCLVEGAY